MEEHTLKGEYISVLKDGRLSYGRQPAVVGQPGSRGMAAGSSRPWTCCCIWRGSGRTAGG